MGNISVRASSLPKGNDPLFSEPPINPSPVEPNNSDTLENPGPMEDLHKKCKEIFPINFDGAKLSVQKGLSNHFQVSHSLNLGGSNHSGYKFGATYVGLRQFGPLEFYPVLVGEIDPSGNVNANVYHRFSETVLTKFQAQIQNNVFMGASLITDYKGHNYTATLTLGNLNILQDTGVVVAHYLQSVSKRLSMGAELAYQRSPQFPGNELAVVSLGTRYQGDDFTLSGTLGTTGLHMCYYQKASDQLQVGVEWETNFRLQESLTAIGYQIDIPKADLVFKAMLDSNWTVGATLEKKLTPMLCSLTLSGMLNHQKNQFRLGLGFIVTN